MGFPTPAATTIMWAAPTGKVDRSLLCSALAAESEGAARRRRCSTRLVVSGSSAATDRQAVAVMAEGLSCHCHDRPAYSRTCVSKAAR
jgi:hypothetical protein